MLSVPAASGLVKPFRSFPGRGAAQSREPGTSRGMRNENQCPGRKRGKDCHAPDRGPEAPAACAGHSRRLGQPRARVRSPTAGQVATPGSPRGTRSRSRTPEQPRCLPGRRLRAVSPPGLPDVRQDGCDLRRPPWNDGPGGPRASMAPPEPPPSGTSSGRALTAGRRASHSLYNAESAFTPQQAGARPGSAQLPETRAARQRLPAGPASGSRRRCRARRGGGCGAGSSRRPRAGRWSCPCPARSRPAGSRR